ncbi:WNT1 [Cordylochernes scorpioides]|uniref:Protein Wnt n=1 Tax=Cordylochernes scorpioides TaxID=51811 RepID=A0ABY6LLF3_9ARAC|nr:WNT1 [Cordylochernes scorpioides]
MIIMHAASNRLRHCKCHGMSGSCSMRTCWMRLAPFRSVGAELLRRYDRASRVQVSNQGNLRRRRVPLQPVRPGRRPPTRKDLVFIEKSPKFCRPNARMGTEGTTGRICPDDGCGRLCCGRGYSTKTEEHFTRCNCTFHWCCHVECKECSVLRNIHTCL